MPLRILLLKVLRIGAFGVAVAAAMVIVSSYGSTVAT